MIEGGGGGGSNPLSSPMFERSVCSRDAAIAQEALTLRDAWSKPWLPHRLVRPILIASTFTVTVPLKGIGTLKGTDTLKGGCSVLRVYPVQTVARILFRLLGHSL